MTQPQDPNTSAATSGEVSHPEPTKGNAALPPSAPTGFSRPKIGEWVFLILALYVSQLLGSFGLAAWVLIAWLWWKKRQTPGSQQMGAMRPIAAFFGAVMLIGGGACVAIDLFAITQGSSNETVYWPGLLIIAALVMLWGWALVKNARRDK